MSHRSFSGIFIAEGPSDMPLGDLVEGLFFDNATGWRAAVEPFVAEVLHATGNRISCDVSHKQVGV